MMRLISKKKFPFAFHGPLKSSVKLWIVSVFFVLSLTISIVLAVQMVAVFLKNAQQGCLGSNYIYCVKKDFGVTRNFLAKELKGFKHIPNQRSELKSNGLQKNINFKAKQAQLRNYLKSLKVSLFFTLSFFGIAVLMYASRHNQSRLIFIPSKWTVRRFYIVALLLSVIVGGLFLGKSPNPMEALVKGVKMVAGFRYYFFNELVVLILFSVFSIIGNKIICGWACPFGGLQELFFIFSSKIKKISVPFYISNSIRILIFIFALGVLFGLVGDNLGVMIYHNINPFNIFILHFKPLLILFSIVFFLIASLFFYRPFCQFICPFGIFSWVLESISITRIRVDSKRCIKCKACYQSCPTRAIENKVVHAKINRECFSCGRCIDSCPTRAIRYD